jgi:hypothetical protein
MIPTVVEPVRASLAPYLSGEPARAWEASYGSWYETPPSEIDEQRFWDLADSAITWIGQRTLDTSHLSQSARQPIGIACTPPSRR